MSRTAKQVTDERDKPTQANNEASLYMVEYLEALDTNGHAGLESLKNKLIQFSQAPWV